MTQAQTSSALIAVCQSNTVWNGVTVADDGRIFVCFPRIEGEKGISIAEIKKDGSIEPYPDANWNSWQPGNPTDHQFVRTNSLRIGPDGNLWVVDTGAPKMGEKSLSGASKLVVIDIDKNAVIRKIPLDGVMKENSFIDDLRIYGSTIYLTDAGQPGIVVMDLQSGKGRRVLEGDKSTTDAIPMIAEGKAMRTQDNKEVLIHADQLEVSPDGKYLYFQPASGPLSRIECRYLQDISLPAAQLSARVEHWFTTPTTGGTAIDAQGNIYVSDINNSRILKISPEGKESVILQDSRLIWCDALWIDKEGYLYMPVGELNRSALFQKGKSTIQFPVHIYKMQIHATPFRS
jgi:sugar lactone lactonase YvrE